MEYKTKLKKLSISLGQRLEQRFIENAGGVAIRTRSLLVLRYPIRNSPWYLVNREDFRVNLNSTRNGPQAGFDQYRVFLGLGRTMGKATIEGGYQIRFANIPDSAIDRLDHIILLRMNYKLR